MLLVLSPATNDLQCNPATLLTQSPLWKTQILHQPLYCMQDCKMVEPNLTGLPKYIYIYIYINNNLNIEVWKFI